MFNPQFPSSAFSHFCRSRLAMLLLRWLLYSHVAEHSNTQLPSFFKLAAVWAGHEAVFCYFGYWRSASGLAWLPYKTLFEWIPKPCIVGNESTARDICLSTLFASNPFEMNWFLPLEGRDPTPMLQEDVGLIPFTHYFTLAMSAFLWCWYLPLPLCRLILLSFDWVAHCRSWCLVAWSFFNRRDHSWLCGRITN